MKSEETYPTAKDTMLAWVPGTDQVRLVPWPDHHQELRAGSE